MTKAIVFCFFYAIFNVAGAAIIKYNLKGKTLSAFSDWVRFLLNVQVILAFALVFLSALILFKALSTGNFSFVIPVAVGINFILTVIVGYYLFKDHLNLVSFIGFALIVSGILLLSLNNTKHA